MLEIFVNLLLAGLFLQSQADQYSAAAAPRQGAMENQTYFSQSPIRKADSVSLGVEVTAPSFLVVDQKSKKILYQKNAQEPRSLASLTKLMTALVFLDHNPGWDKTVTVSGDDYREGAVNYFIAGEKVTVKDLFYGTLVASANEAAVALARSTGLSPDEFVAAMNQKAEELGLSQAAFYDLTGLDDRNQATAAEVAVIALAAFNEPEILPAVSTKEYQIGVINKGISRKISSTDKILRQTFGLAGASYSVVAGKTGYLERAGYCFAGLVKNQLGDNIVSVVMGSDTIDSRFSDTKALAYWVFSNYQWPNVAN